MARFSKYERETIILWNQTDDPVSIYTFDKPLIRRLEAFREKYPELCSRIVPTRKAPGLIFWRRPGSPSG